MVKKKKVKNIRIISLLIIFMFTSILLPNKVFAAQGGAPTIRLSTTAPASSVTVTIDFPDDAVNKYYSYDDGANWHNYNRPFNVSKNTTIIAQYRYRVRRYIYDSLISSITITNIENPTTTTSSDGDWHSKNVQLKNTSESELMVRVGDIDNFGFRFDSGFDPFSGNLTVSHGYPWKTPEDEPSGLDRIMVVSGYDYDYYFKTTGVNRDGYTEATSRSGNDDIASNNVSAINMQYDLTGINVQNAIMQMFLDDFQPGNAKGISNGNVYYNVTINGNRIPELETIVNNLDESGPKGRLVTFTVPQNYIQLIRTGNISIKFDDTRSGRTGDGYAVDFIKLLINPASLDKTGTINGKVTEKFTGKPLAGVNISTGAITTITDSDGRYTLLKVPAGQAVVTASKDKYETISKPVDLVAKTTNTSDFELINTQKPGLPVISEDIMVPTNSSVNISIKYPGSPNKTYYFIGDSLNGSSNWIPYTGTFKVNSNSTIWAKSVSLSGVESDVASFGVVNIDKTVPSAPKITPSTTKLTNKDVTVTVNFDSTATVKEISTDGGAHWSSYNDPVSISQNTTVVARCANSLGTKSPESSLKIDYIDKEPPTATVTYSDNTNGTVTATLKGENEKIVVTNNDGKESYIFYKNGTFTFEFVDAAGNTGTALAEATVGTNKPIDPASREER